MFVINHVDNESDQVGGHDGTFIQDWREVVPQSHLHAQKKMKQGVHVIVRLYVMINRLNKFQNPRG